MTPTFALLKAQKVDFSTSIVTPKNTTESAPLETRLTLSRGIINGGFIYFPSGPSALLHVQIYAGALQIAPVNRNASFSLDNCVMPLSIFYNLYDPPYQITMRTWNTSTTYDHFCAVTLWLKEMKDQALGNKFVTRDWGAYASQALNG